MHGVVVGRERELAEANGFLDDVAARACCLLLAGEAGIGKTTLWSASLDEAGRRGYAVLAARPSEAEADLAFAALTDVFAEIDGRVLNGLPETQRDALEHALRRSAGRRAVDPTAVALAVLGTLRRVSAGGPAVVGIDDLQWVDAPSLRALTFAFRRLAGAHVGLLATMRTGFADELTEMAVRNPGFVARIDVGGLSKRHLSRLVLERTGRTLSPPQLGKLARLSGGNPFYALELVGTGDPELRVPETLGAALRARLAGLSDEARAAGLAAAVLGHADDGVIARAHAAGLAELRAQGLVEGPADASRLAHPLLASTLLELHTDEDRRAAHRALAGVLDDPDERALHLGRGTDEASEEVAEELERAAVRLDARGAPEAAAGLAERAAELTPDPVASTRRLLLAADLYQAAGEAQAHVLPLLERLARSFPAGPDRARVLVRLGWLGAQQDTITNDEVVAYEEQALAEAEGTPEIVATAQVVLARQRGIGGDYGAALRHAELAVDAATGLDRDGMFPSPAGELAMARFFAGRGLDEELFAEGIELEARTARVGEPYQSPRRAYALALLQIGELDRARALLTDLLSLSEELERVRSAAGCLLNLVELEVRAGNLARAEAQAAEFAHLDRQLRGDLGAEWYPSGIVAAHLGRVDDARRILTAGAEYSRGIASSIWAAHHLWALGQLELAVGDLAAAKEALTPLPGLLREAGLGEWAVHPVHPDAIETLVALGELDEAVELTAELEEYATRLDRPWGLATAARSRALIAAARGANDEALAFVERALAAHERLDWPFERARTLLVAGVMLRRAGRRRDAAAALDEARGIFTSLGNPLWLAKVEAEARRLGGRRGASDALTPTEERVAELAGQGLRNAEIAAQLFVTTKTVEATLSRVYRKLGIRSRTELARRLAERAAGTA